MTPFFTETQGGTRRYMRNVLHFYKRPRQQPLRGPYQHPTSNKELPTPKCRNSSPLLSAVCRHLLSAALLALVVGCGRETTGSKQEDSVRTEDMSQGDIRLEFRIEPARVHYDTDLLLTIAVDVPSQLDIEIPALHDRVQGFILQGTYATDVVESHGRKQWEVHARLTPSVTAPHRIAPMAVQVTDRGHSPPESSWLATRAVELEVAPLFDDVPDSVHADLAPVWIGPSFLTVAAWFGGLLLVAVIGYLAFRLTRRLHKEAVLRRLSPRERAMRELEELLRKHLVEKDQVKDFYVELTMIVRRYIERAHGVRAPEQTTEEFLAAVRDDDRFSPDVVNRLREFLEAADLVKFAAYHPDATHVDNATRTARKYVEADAQECERADVETVEGGA